MKRGIRTDGAKISRRGMLLAPAMAAAAAAQEQKKAGSSGAWLPKLGENIGTDPSSLRWLRQMGCQYIYAGIPDRDRKGYLSTADILSVKKLCQDADVTLEVMTLPGFGLAMLGQPGRDEQIENVRRTIRAAGEAGVPTLVWNFWPDFYWDERVGYYPVKARGESTQRAFDYDRVKDGAPFEGIGAVSGKEMWDRLLYFAKPVVETAEKAGVRLALHPCDPPVPIMRGVARVIHSPDDYLRFFKEVPSPANGMAFCQGVFTEMGVDVLQEIRRFGRMGRIHAVHFRAVRGKVPRYTEVFLDEGDVNMIQAMKTYKEIGYTGIMVSDHTPVVEGDKMGDFIGSGHVGRSFSLGYMRAAVQAVNTL